MSIRFAAIGSTTTTSTARPSACCAAGAELVRFYAPEPDLAADFAERYPQARAVADERRDPGGRDDPAHRQRRHPGRARAAGRRGDAPRQGLHERQAGRHHAGAAGRGAPGAGRDRAHLLDLLSASASRTRATVQGRASWCRPARSAAWSRRSASGRTGSATPRGRPGSSSARATAASSPTSPRTRSTSSCSSPARPAPRSSSRRSAISPIPQYPELEDFGDVPAARRWRHRLHPRRLVHARRPGDLGRRPPDDPRHRGLHRAAQVRRHRRAAGRRPPVPGRPARATRYIDCTDVTLPYGRQLVARHPRTAPRRR